MSVYELAQPRDYLFLNCHTYPDSIQSSRNIRTPVWQMIFIKLLGNNKYLLFFCSQRYFTKDKWQCFVRISSAGTHSCFPQHSVLFDRLCRTHLDINLFKSLCFDGSIITPHCYNVDKQLSPPKFQVLESPWLQMRYKSSTSTFTEKTKIIEAADATVDDFQHMDTLCNEAWLNFGVMHAMEIWLEYVQKYSYFLDARWWAADLISTSFRRQSCLTISCSYPPPRLVLRHIVELRQSMN